MTKPLIWVLALAMGLTGCERVTKLANQAELNARAIGAACRHSGRSLEDCFRRNERVSKADIYAGWREMNEYMAKNKIDVVPAPPDPVPKKRGVANVEISSGDEDSNSTKSPGDGEESADNKKTAGANKQDEATKTSGGDKPAT